MAQGLLTGRRVTALQRWALSYAMVEDRNDQIAAEERRYKMELSIHKPELYERLLEQEQEDEWTPVDNISEIAAYLEQVGAEQFASAADDDREGWL